MLITVCSFPVAMVLCRFKGPIPSDLAYLMTSGSVTPEVYTDHEDTILRTFYDEFQLHTKAYTQASGYTYEKFVDEYKATLHIMFMYVGVLVLCIVF